MVGTQFEPSKTIACPVVGAVTTTGTPWIAVALPEPPVPIAASISSTAGAVHSQEITSPIANDRSLYPPVTDRPLSTSPTSEVARYSQTLVRSEYTPYVD